MSWCFAWENDMIVKLTENYDGIPNIWESRPEWIKLQGTTIHMDLLDLYKLVSQNWQFLEGLKGLPTG